MSRSGYTDDDDENRAGLWRGAVLRAIKGERGQAFLKELAAAMDAMPEKILIADELINDEGQCCAIGVVCKARGIDVAKIDYENAKQVGAAVGISKALAAEIEYENDFRYDADQEEPAARWQRMQKWVQSQIR